MFDASARPCVRELQGTYFAEVCEQLMQSCPQRFSEVPAGNNADEAILDIATMLGQKIITNDQFRDHAPRYPWLETEAEKRLHTMFACGTMPGRIASFSCGRMPQLPCRLRRRSARLSRNTSSCFRIATSKVLGQHRLDDQPCADRADAPVTWPDFMLSP